jgi:hypothetical protein
VFNITIAEARCYFANGVLVHNCDALSWAVRLTLSRAPPREAAPPEPKSWKDKLRMVMKGSFTGSGHMAA